MPIDIQHEHLLTFAEAAKLLPRRRARKKPHVATIYRWASRGLRGIALEAIQVGGTSCTSREALQRFFERLHTAMRTPGPTEHRPNRSREKAIREAERRLHEDRF
jgi:alkylation response protein AidB-like acyl-CoA dehydrogenase